jgi:hypothetical protein
MLQRIRPAIDAPVAVCLIAGLITPLAATQRSRSFPLMGRKAGSSGAMARLRVQNSSIRFTAVTNISTAGRPRPAALSTTRQDWGNDSQPQAGQLHSRWRIPAGDRFYLPACNAADSTGSDFAAVTFSGALATRGSASLHGGRGDELKDCGATAGDYKRDNIHENALRPSLKGGSVRWGNAEPSHLTPRNAF